MKVVILAAGKSTRTHPLTINKPKPLLKVANQTLIEHNLEQLVDLVDEAIIIVGYKADMIKKHLGDRFKKLKLTYVVQKEQLGTGHALLQVEKLIKDDRFAVMMGDDLYFRGDMRRCLRYPLSVMVKRVENYSDFGVMIRKEGKILDLIEKPGKFISDLANTAFYVFNKNIFTCLRKLKKSDRGEYELTEGMKVLALKEDIFSVEAKVWIPVGYPWNLLEADQIIRDTDVSVGKNTTITGKVSYSTIGSNCVINGFVKNSIIGDNVKISKESVVEDSIIGDNVVLTGTMKTSEKTEIMVKKNIIRIENFGSVIGDNCKLTNVLIQPGTLIWPGISKKDAELKGIIKK